MGNQVGAGAQTLEVLIDRIRIAKISQALASHGDKIFLLLFPFKMLSSFWA